MTTTLRARAAAATSASTGTGDVRRAAGAGGERGETEMLTVGGLFSGIGGIELGLQRAGMQIRWMVENDPFCQKVLAKHWPNVERFEDVRDCGKHNLAPVDLIVGGFPCQDVSLAGQRAGLEGNRTTLWTEFARLICEIKPRWVLAENVPGLLSSDNGQFFGQVLRNLAQIGYDAEWDCIPASAIGTPHGRDRVFIVAYSQMHRSYNESQKTVFISDKWRTFARVGYGGSPVGRRTYALQEVAWNNSTWGSVATKQDISPMVRVAHGIPHRVDRLRALGNAVVPQVITWLGRRIVACDRHTLDLAAGAGGERGGAGS